MLAISVDQKTRKDLKCDERGCFEASSVDLLGNTYPICIITGQPVLKLINSIILGYPILNNARDFGNGKSADQSAWQTFSALIRTHPSDHLLDVQGFLSRWASSSIF